MDLNQVSLTGRLTTNPELRTSNSGKKYAFFTLACNYSKDTTYFISCVCFENVAENLVNYCNKGSRVIIGGCLQTTSDREKRTIMQVKVSVLININESEARESLAETRENIRKERKEEKELEKYEQKYSNPMTNMDFEINDEDLPF